MDPRSGGSKGGGSKGGGSKGGVGVRRVGVRRGEPKISRFFPSPAAKFVLFFPLWGSSRGILVVFLKRRGAQLCTFGVLWLSCEAPAGEGKKKRNFGRSRGRAVPGRAVPGRAVPGRAVLGKGGSGCKEHDQTKTLKPTPTRETPHHETVKPTPTPHSTPTPHTQHTQTHKHTNTQTQVELGLAKVGLAKLGRQKELAKLWPKSVWPKSAMTVRCPRTALPGTALPRDPPPGPPPTQQPENSKRAHLTAQALQTPPKFHEKTPREGRKARIFRRERENKARNFGPITLRAPTLRVPTLRAPTLRAATFEPTLRVTLLPPFGSPPFGLPLLLGLGPHPSHPSPPFGPTPLELPPPWQTKVGRIRMAKVGLAKVGFDHLNT